MANIKVSAQGGNNVNVEVTPVAKQTIEINRGVAGVGIESISIYYDGTTYYLDFLYTDGTNELVPLPATAAGVTSFNTRVGAVTLTLADVTTALGYTPPTPTGGGASGTWAISVSGNAATVTNGVVTTGTYSDPLWITALAASKITGTLTNSQLANSSITINGTPVSLGGSVTTGTVTSVTGTSPIASSGGTTPAISIAQATTSTSGYLSSTDWNTFNSKGNGTVTSVTATSPVTSTGGATPVIAMPAATTSVSGYLTSADWNTFNSKGNGTVTSVAATAGTGISVSGSPITSSGTFNIVNTAPDQVVVLTSGTGINTSGTYPNFTITNSLPDQVVSLTASTAINVTGTYPDFTIANTAPDQTVVLTAGTGINTSGAYPNFTITNSLPDQIVSLTGAGTTTVTGTYPNFTITSSGGGGGTVTSVGITPLTGITVSNSPITSSGNITVGLSTKLTAIENLSGAGFFTQNGSGNIAGRTIQAGTGISVAHGNGSSQDPEISNTGVLGVTGTSPVASSGGQNPVISMPAATTSVSGYLTSTDWNTFNGKQDALISGTNIKTVNSNSLLGSGNISVGTVTSVAALTLGTTGTDLSSTVANDTTTPVITLNVPTASATNRGVLSASDWTTFNGKYSVGGALGTPSSGTLTNCTGLPNAGLVNSSVTFNGQSVALGASGTITANTTNSLTIGSGLSGTSFNGSGAVTIAIDSTVATLTGSQTLTNKTLTDPSIIGTIIEDIFDLTDGATVDIDPANGSIQTLTLTSTGRTLTFTNMVNGEAITLMVNDGTAGTITTWNATFVNNGATAPTLSTTGFTVVSIWKVAGTVYAAVVGNA